jgi:hypothetical protein
MIAKARYHNGGEHYRDTVRIGKKEFDIETFVEMWNEIPEEIRKPIQDKTESICEEE